MNTSESIMYELFSNVLKIYYFALILFYIELYLTTVFPMSPFKYIFSLKNIFINFSVTE